MRMRSRLLGIALLLMASFGALGVAGAPSASAHPLGNFTINRYGGLTLLPGEVRLRYVLDMAEIPTFQERRRIDSNADGVLSPAEREAWAEAESGELLSHVIVSANGSQVHLRALCRTMTLRQGQAGLPILRLVVTYGGSIPSIGTLRYEDGNFPGRIGWREVTAAGGAGVRMTRSSVPSRSVSDELLAYPKDLLSNPLAVSAATVSYSGPSQASTTPGPSCSSVARTVVASGFASLVTKPLGSPLVLALALLLAFGFGAAHALLPGHGKTITAAYLVGSEARTRTAVVAGTAVALMHTVSVVALGVVAVVVLRVATDRIYPWLGLLTGVVAVVLGAALFLLRVRARRNGLHPWHHHHHAESDDHDHDHVDERRSRPGLAALAVAGGILPSPTAVLALTSSISLHHIGYGLALIGAFSLGLAASLIGVGLFALRARAFVARRFRGANAALLPIVSAAVIVAFGAFFVARGLTQIG